MSEWFPVIWAQDDPILACAIRRKGWDRENAPIRFFIRTVAEIADGMRRKIPDVIVRNQSMTFDPTIQFKSSVLGLWRRHVETLVYWDLQETD